VEAGFVEQDIDEWPVAVFALPSEEASQGVHHSVHRLAVVVLACMLLA
jgi:hypothetical protein